MCDVIWITLSQKAQTVGSLCEKHISNKKNICFMPIFKLKFQFGMEKDAFFKILVTSLDTPLGSGT